MSNKLENITMNQTPIEVALGIDNEGKTTAKKLYTFLELNPTNYSKWYRTNILENEFAEESTDYWVFVPNDENPQGGRPTQDFKLTASFAKKLSMLQKNEKGELARNYFIKVENKIKEIVKNTDTFNGISTELQAVIVVDKRITKVENKVSLINEDLQQFKQDLPILGVEESRITSTVRRVGVKCLGGKESNAYKDKSLRGKVYSGIYGELKRYFGVATYKAIKRSQCDTAIQVIEMYEMPSSLAEQIKDCNNQINMEVA